MRALVIFVIALTLALCACGGGGSSASQVGVTPPVSDPPPPPVQLTCAMQGYGGTYPNCVCPEAWQVYTGATSTVAGVCTGTPPPPVCIPPEVGTYPDCALPPPPPVCTPPEVGTYPDCALPPPPTMQFSYCPDADFNPASNVCSAPGATITAGQSATLIWDSTNTTGCYGAAGWPSNDEVTASGFVDTGALTLSTSYSLTCSGAGGNATASLTVNVSAATVPPPGACPVGTSPAPLSCTCPAADLQADGSCIVPQSVGPPPAFTISLSASPATIVDSTGCPQDYNNTPCQALLTESDSLGDESADTCSLNGETPQAGNVGWIIGPYPSDGPQVLTVACGNAAGSASASITVIVVPPYIPPVDTFTGTANGDGTYTFTWVTTSQLGQGGCDVELFNELGTETTLTPGGTPSGSATSGFLGGAYDPWAAILYCSGVPDPGVPQLEYNP